VVIDALYLLCLYGEVVEEGVLEGVDVFFSEEDGLSDALNDGRRHHERPLRARLFFGSTISKKYINIRVK